MWNLVVFKRDYEVSEWLDLRLYRVFYVTEDRARYYAPVTSKQMGELLDDKKPGYFMPDGTGTADIMDLRFGFSERRTFTVSEIYDSRASMAGKTMLIDWGDYAEVIYMEVFAYQVGRGLLKTFY
jgi:hypothetical protein